MSGSGKETNIIAGLNTVIDVDLQQTIKRVKNDLLNENTPFGFDLFKKHSQSLRTLQELIDVAPETGKDEEKVKGERNAVEGLISDVCLPFLRSFAPSYDGRADLFAALLNICDMTLVCLKRSSQEMIVKVLELCLQSLIAYHRECSRHSDSASDQALDILCALELLCTTLEVPSLPHNNQNDELYHRIFSAALSILSHLEEKTANRLISFVIVRLIQQQTKERNIYLQETWKLVEADVHAHDKGKRKLSTRNLQQHLTMMCSMANFFFPLTSETVNPDVRQCQAFWELVQLGLYHENPAIRKRSAYLLKRIIDTCEKSDVDLNPPDLSSGASSLPYFWWSKKQQERLSKVWEDALLLLETLDEKQTHVIKPILPRMQTLLDASKKENGSVVLHTSWIVTILMRAFSHESVFIVRWASDTVLFMDFTAVPFMEQGQLQFLTQQLLGFLQDLKLYQRPDGTPAGSCTSVGTGLKQFFANVCKSLESKQQKVEFVQHVLSVLVKDNWSSVPLVFITQGVSCISPDAILGQQALITVREIVNISLTSLENIFRGAIECFMTKTVLSLLDKDAVSVDEFMETLAVLEREESLQRGTQLWSTVVSWLLTAATEKDHSTWNWSAMEKTLTAMVDSYLTVSTDATGSPLAETGRVTKIARFVALMSDCEYKMKQNKMDSRGKEDGKPLLTATVLKAVDVVNNINVRVYMPVLKADRAIFLLLSCAKELGKGKNGTQDLCQKELCDLVHGCWNELLTFVEKRTLLGKQESEQDHVDLDLVIFYADAVKTLGELLPVGAGVNGLTKAVDACTKVMDTSSTASPLQQVAALSLLSAVAQVVDTELRREARAHNSVKSEGLQDLSNKLWKLFSTMSLDCDIFTGHTGGSSAHQGRHVCQYMMSLWQCLRVLLTHKPGVREASLVLHAALEAFSISSGECDMPIMHCLELVMPELLQGVDHHAKVMQVIRIAWGKVYEEIKSWSFWLKMEAYVNMVLQKPLLMLMDEEDVELGVYMNEVLERFFEVGQEKAGMLNLVIARLCQLWAEPEGTALATKMVSTIVDACMFGTVHKKAERLCLDVYMYIETLKENCSVNEILSSSSKNDVYVRLAAINFLSSLKPGVAEHKRLAMAVLEEGWKRYEELYQMSTFRQFTNSLPHLHKHRAVQIFPVLDQFIGKDLCLDFCKQTWDALVLECHPSVRQNLEWLLMRLVHRYPQELLPFLWKCFDQFSDKRNISLISLLHIVTRVGPELPTDLREDFYIEAIPLVMPWTMAHHFNTRLHGQAAIYKLWGQCQEMKLKARQYKIVESCVKFLNENGNSSAVLGKLMGNYFYSHFNFLRDYSMETLFYTLPRLACLCDIDWMHPDLFYQLDASWQTNSDSHLMPLYNESKTLAACEPGPWKMKATTESFEDTETTDGDVQKKIIPWRLMTPDSSAEQEYSHRRKGRNQDGLVLVTSLINKIPNLGGLCRTSEIFGVSEFVIGNLSYTDDRMFQTLSVTAEKWIPITEVQFFRLGEFLEEKKRESYTLVGVEQTANSVDLTKYKFPKKTLLVLGNEKEGIPPDILQQLDVCVEIPQQGIIRSLNVHVSGALLVWEYTRQQMENSDAE